MAAGLTSATFTENDKEKVRFDCWGQATGSGTYVLNSALTGTTSTEIDLGTSPGLYVSVSGTAAQMEVEFSPSTITGQSNWRKVYTFLGPDNFCVPKRARWVRFTNSALNSTGQRMSVWYFTPSDSQTVSGSTSSGLGVSTTPSTTTMQAVTQSANQATNSSTTLTAQTIVSATASKSVVVTGYHFSADKPCRLTLRSTSGQAVADMLVNSYGGESRPFVPPFKLPSGDAILYDFYPYNGDTFFIVGAEYRIEAP